MKPQFICPSVSRCFLTPLTLCSMQPSSKKTCVFTSPEMSNLIHGTGSVISSNSWPPSFTLSGVNTALVGDRFQQRIKTHMYFWPQDAVCRAVQAQKGVTSSISCLSHFHVNVSQRRRSVLVNKILVSAAKRPTSTAAAADKWRGSRLVRITFIFTPPVSHT